MTVIIRTGYRAKLVIRNKCLVICQCSTSKCNGTDDTVIERVPMTVDAIVVDVTTGLVTPEALAWMADANILFTFMRNGQVLARGERLPEADVWHAQLAYAQTHLTGITQRLMRLKLDGQASNAKLMRRPDVADRIMTLADKHDQWAERSNGNPRANIGEHHRLEGHAAQAYWSAWRTVHVPFLTVHMTRVPPRWLTFTSRQSQAMNDSHRNASDPCNAMINYAHTCAYRLAEQACHATGLSPLIACSHVKAYRRDRDGIVPRPSMALDLSEAIQPYADRVVLDMLDYGQGIPGYLQRTDFTEVLGSDRLPSGTVRVDSPVLRARILAGVQAFQDEMSETALWVRRQLGVLRRKRLRTELEEW